MPVFQNEGGIDKEVDMIFYNHNGIDKLVAGGGSEPSSFLDFWQWSGVGSVGSWNFPNVQNGDLLVLFTTRTGATVAGYDLNASTEDGRILSCIWDGTQPTGGSFPNGIQRLSRFRGVAGVGAARVFNFPSGSANKTFTALSGVEEGSLCVHGIGGVQEFEGNSTNTRFMRIAAQAAIQVDRFYPTGNVTFPTSSTAGGTAFSFEVVI